MDKYQANSLRKNRREGFEKDISDAYTLFSYRYSDPHIITINDFYDFWNSSQLGLIVCVYMTPSSFELKTKNNKNTFRRCIAS